jgi:hypothetical protein
MMINHQQESARIVITSHQQLVYTKTHLNYELHKKRIFRILNFKV